jgi:hypothetical protein
MVKVQDQTPPGGPVTLAVRIQPGTWSSGLVRPGDTIQLNYQGPVYVLMPAGFPIVNGFFDFSNTNADPDGFSTLMLTALGDLSQVSAVPWPHVSTNRWSDPVAFAVSRQPVRTAIAPLQLPRGTAIDLAWSGTPSFLFRPVDTASVRIMFSPNGSLDRLWASGLPEGSRVIEPIYLLIGRRDRVPLERAAPFTSPAEDGRANLEEPSNLWVAVQPQTGSTITEKVADTGAIPWTQEALKIAAAREFASEGRAMEGR